MITRRTKVQLLAFVIITLLGVSYVGAKYARLDRIFRDDSFTVVGHFESSGGIFAGAEVTYRGVGIGQVDRLEVTDAGVDVFMDIEKSYDEIPADTLAVVGNRSAVGEQYVELQPEVDDAPFLEEDSEIPTAKTRTPIQTDELLTNLSTTVSSVDLPSLRTSVREFGKAFGGSGPDLQRIIDSGNEFLEAADANFDITTQLIEDSNVVLRGQIASETGLRTFAEQLSLFSGTLADADPALRGVIEAGGPAAEELRRLIEDNRQQLGELLNNVRTVGEIFVKRLPGLEQVLVLYPYIVEGGFTVAARSPDDGLVYAHFGNIITDKPVCTNGYQTTVKRTPQDRFGDPPMNFQARCTDPPTETNARGAQNIPPRPPTGYDASPVVAVYDRDTRALTWLDHPTTLAQLNGLAPSGTVAPPSSGGESWSWLLRQPARPAAGRSPGW